MTEMQPLTPQQAKLLNRIAEAPDGVLVTERPKGGYRVCVRTLRRRGCVTESWTFSQDHPPRSILRLTAIGLTAIETGEAPVRVTDVRQLPREVEGGGSPGKGTTGGGRWVNPGRGKGRS